LKLLKLLKLLDIINIPTSDYRLLNSLITLPKILQKILFLSQEPF
jgi:hypothetical protein